MRPAFAFASLVGSALVGSACLLIGKTHGGHYPLGLEPIYPALVTSILVFIADRGTRAKEAT